VYDSFDAMLEKAKEDLNVQTTDNPDDKSDQGEVEEDFM